MLIHVLRCITCAIVDITGISEVIRRESMFFVANIHNMSYPLALSAHLLTSATWISSHNAISTSSRAVLSTGSPTSSSLLHLKVITWHMCKVCGSGQDFRILYNHFPFLLGKNGTHFVDNRQGAHEHYLRFCC
ncbi:hypothetical protein Lalb_Chr23g0276261 [Lupinus albus]|uniref:Uncharacterized protein n=1 Tax=Lupinus albus TaxID=3870 RepID=A0A6A4NLW9_LUPAL|nr:hypothetical protein Lalb_Chr23g0276261 [Lupinus albus]